MTRARIGLGQRGEELAARAVTQHGYRILARNWRCPMGEADLIAQRADELTFFEVRTRRGTRAGTPEESLTPRKRAHMEAVARHYLAEHLPEADPTWHLGFVAVELDAQGHLLRVTIYPDLEGDGWSVSSSSLLSDPPP